ncbi:putative secreted protein [Salmonella enterica subsp. enterica]|uniref:Putative secreted protein n=3 Tax=Salmonella enterica TaxID=28901 RepID=A0A447MY40_SALET|nr:putative secreted protein [Salmonella enterica subsp. enterica]
MIYETFSDNSSANRDLDLRMAFASDPVIPWATNSGGTESTHIAAMGEDLNAQHQQITHTHEGVWAANSGSIQADEAALTSNKPPVQGHPELMPHQG